MRKISTREDFISDLCLDFEEYTNDVFESTNIDLLPDGDGTSFNYLDIFLSLLPEKISKSIVDLDIDILDSDLDSNVTNGRSSGESNYFVDGLLKVELSEGESDYKILFTLKV